MDEPKDGDFVAYLERLQQESQARLAEGGLIAKTTPARPPSNEQLYDGSRKSRPLTRSEAEAVVALLASSAAFGRLLGPALTIGIGVFVLLYAIVAGDSVVPFVVGAALLWYGVPRLRRAMAATPPSEREQTRALVARMFKAMQHRSGR